MNPVAFLGAEIFDGTVLHSGRALLLKRDCFQGIVQPADIPDDYEQAVLDGGTLTPGFIDLQVNGGSGVMFNDATTPEGLATIAAAHAATGTRGILPTLITDSPEKSRAAVQAAEQAIAAGIPGILGIHLEGPHISLARKGAHDPALIRPMGPEDEAFLVDAARRLPNVMVTVAPESVSLEQISRLSNAGLIVSLGHTDCGFADAEAAFKAGASCVTHLFNAMSQLGNREPGLVGAALDAPTVSAGLIADNIHVHAATVRVAMAAKRGPGRIFLVTDAMSTVGSDITEFALNGRRVLRRDRRLTLEDGTLAGADSDFPTAIRVISGLVGVGRADALAMATSVPAGVLRDPRELGRFVPGQRWNGIYLDTEGRVAPIP